MILTSSVYELLLDKIRKDKRGLSVSIDTFNRIIPSVNEKIYMAYVKDFEEGLESSDTLGLFKVFNTNIALVAGVGVMPTNYYQIIGKPRSNNATPYTWVDVITTYEHAEREEDFLTKATITHPTCQIGGDDGSGNIQVRVTPTTITNLYLDYLRETTTPFLDYYVNDTTLNYTLLQDLNGLNVPLGCTYRTGTVGGALVLVNSATVDFEWTTSDLPLIMAYLLQELGITLPDEVLFQGGQAEEVKLLSK